LSDGTPLKLQKVYWVQGNKIRRNNNATLWINDEKLDDDRFHIHHRNDYYVQHTHSHHINAPPKEARRFGVRCVKNSL